MYFLAIGDGVWNALIATVGVVVAKWMLDRSSDKAADRAERAADKAANRAEYAAEKVAIKTAEVAVKTEAVRTTLATDKKEINVQLGAIHALVNSAMGEQLQINEIALGRLAKLPGATKADIVAWEKSKEKLATHASKQSIADNTT